MTTSSEPISIAGRPEAELGGAASVLVRQRRDHARLSELLRRVRETSGALGVIVAVLGVAIGASVLRSRREA